jgi:integrase
VARRRYQTGRIFKRGKRRKVWVARWREDVIQANGNRGRIQRSVVLRLVSEIPTQRQAHTLLEERLRPLNQGLQGPQSTMSFKVFAEGDWSTLMLPTLKHSTRLGYRRVLGRHLLPYFGNWRLCDITKLDVQQFVAEKFRQGLAWQTVRNTWIILSTILDSASEFGYLAANPARGAKFPPHAPRRGPEILAPEELARLLLQLWEPVKTMVMLAALTGVRVGELAGLAVEGSRSKNWHTQDRSIGF